MCFVCVLFHVCFSCVPVAHVDALSHCLYDNRLIHRINVCFFSPLHCFVVVVVVFFFSSFFASNSRTYKHSKRIVLQWVFRDMRSKCPKFVSCKLGKMFANINQWDFTNLWFKSLDMNTKY